MGHFFQRLHHIKLRPSKWMVLLTNKRQLMFILFQLRLHVLTTFMVSNFHWRPREYIKWFGQEFDQQVLETEILLQSMKCSRFSSTGCLDNMRFMIITSQYLLNIRDACAFICAQLEFLRQLSNNQFVIPFMFLDPNLVQLVRFVRMLDSLEQNFWKRHSYHYLITNNKHTKIISKTGCHVGTD